MVAQFTERHVGKRVVNADGVEVGTVSGVDDGDLLVEVSPDADPDTLSTLNWDGVVNQEVHRLRDQHVSNVSENVVRLNV